MTANILKATPTLTNQIHNDGTLYNEMSSNIYTSIMVSFEPEVMQYKAWLFGKYNCNGDTFLRCVGREIFLINNGAKKDNMYTHTFL